MESNSGKESEEVLRRRAYVLGLELKNKNLDQDVIYARLEKKGIPADLAKQVATDIMLDEQSEFNEKLKPELYTAFIGVGAGLVSSIVFAIGFPGHIVIPVGLILSGVIHSLVVYEKMK